MLRSGPERCQGKRQALSIASRIGTGAASTPARMWPEQIDRASGPVNRTNAAREDEGERNPALARSVERALDILSLFTDGSTELGVSEIARRLGLSKGTVFRLLQTLG